MQHSLECLEQVAQATAARIAAGDESPTLDMVVYSIGRIADLLNIAPPACIRQFKSGSLRQGVDRCLARLASEVRDRREKGWIPRLELKGEIPALLQAASEAGLPIPMSPTDYLVLQMTESG